MSCNTDKHFTGSTDCIAIRKQSSSPSDLGPATAIVSDQTSVTGVSDPSRNRERRKRNHLEKTPFYEKAGDVTVLDRANAVLVGGNYTDLKRDHGVVELKGGKVAGYEKIGSVSGKPLLKKTGWKITKRSSSVPTSDKRLSKKEEEQRGNLEQAFDLFNDKIIN